MKKYTDMFYFSQIAIGRGGSAVRRIATACLCPLLLASGGLSDAGPPDPDGPSAVALAFNEAMRAGDAVDTIAGE